MRSEDLRQLEETTGLREEAGWVGLFTRRNAAGAMPAGTRIVKTRMELGDANPTGTLGVVLGSLSDPSIAGGHPMYFIEWEHTPKKAIACAGWKVGPAE